MIELFGITNCDTMKKARKWLDDHGVEYHFHDFRKFGLERRMLLGWVSQSGWEALLNRRGMMWRKLPDEEKTGIDEERAIEIMLKTPSIIKRPVLLKDGILEIGFSAERYDELFG
jgi:arsenate reductase